MHVINHFKNAYKYGKLILFITGTLDIMHTVQITTATKYETKGKNCCKQQHSTGAPPPCLSSILLILCCYLINSVQTFATIYLRVFKITEFFTNMDKIMLLQFRKIPFEIVLQTKI